ncbi:MAG: hypothetical protein A2Y24_02470 [Clostridiales bacterium GWE2_32_10]|nr:MAG: hypothetical protein A2Y24_02470 [Clostridiales bacterium GWE2_32_10]HBY20666.1 hypothetical protein [Clostridiales bacterium]
MRYVIGELTYVENEYIFKYNSKLSEAEDEGFTFYPGFPDRNKEYRSRNLFINVSTRLPNKDRPDYKEILERYGLDVNA